MGKRKEKREKEGIEGVMKKKEKKRENGGKIGKVKIKNYKGKSKKFSKDLFLLSLPKVVNFFLVYQN